MNVDRLIAFLIMGSVPALVAAHSDSLKFLFGAIIILLSCAASIRASDRR